ncbi:hypothetical protein P4O66_008582 [Electrophorus voltai]|uniref:Serpin domain-containing protein n=1 Tax=Electrophorus voltai TaxID=2609070 RepID=A0AAD9DY25_9TELE|nr:hypothetical protein P4O66_008582 [Electrophorus voltai]
MLKRRRGCPVGLTRQSHSPESVSNHLQQAPESQREKWTKSEKDFYSSRFLQEQLAVLGVEDAWDPKVADFSALSGRGKGTLHLGSVVHWAFLELASESGGEDGTSEDEHVEKPKLLYADHSFIVLVKESSMGALLLLGALDLAQGHDEL